MLSTCVEHKHLQGTDFRLDTVEHLDNGFFVARIARYAFGPAALRLNLRHQFTERLDLSARRNGDQSPFCEPSGDRPAQRIPSADHDRGSTIRHQNGTTMPPMGASQFSRLTRFWTIS